MKKILFLLIFLVFFLLFASYKKWIIITPQGKQAMTQLKDLTMRVGSNIKEGVVKFYQDVRE